MENGVPGAWLGLAVSVRRAGPQVRLLLRGHVGLLTVPDLIGQLAEILDDRNPTVIVDLSGVTAMDRCGARFLGRVSSPGLGGCRIVLRNASPAARDALAVIGLPVLGLPVLGLPVFGPPVFGRAALGPRVIGLPA